MNHQGTALIGRIAQYAIAVLGIIFFIMILSGNNTGIDGGLFVTYIAFFISAGVVLVFSLIGLTKKSLIGIGAFVVVFALAYAMSDGSVKPEWNITESTSKLISTGLHMLMIATLGAIGAIVYGEVTRMFK